VTSIFRWGAAAVGVGVFLFDWSGYDKWQPDLFFPKPLREIWWHLPIEVGLALAIARIVELSPGEAEDVTAETIERRRRRRVWRRNSLILGAFVLLAGNLLVVPLFGWERVRLLDDAAILMAIGAVVLA